ncbi:CRISPR-associated protein Cas2 [Roseibium sp. Sym1]|uniref:CRISPR-associated protein Cas2 n=1 Tax=Roseibium sp. Sym1 TaxID=3016006 RepID=UPI0022B4AAAE|nr:CRISPR-associated protein Cas2 [Roseibium sp. Sym1]
MAYFAVSYQLNNSKDYPTLWDEMKRLNAHKVMRSFFFLDLNNTASEVRDHLQGFIDDDDAVMVVPFDQRPYHHRAYQGTNNWISERFG